MTPKSVLDAGKAERERYQQVGNRYACSVYFAGNRAPDSVRLHIGTRTECQYFIDDRVFRAMLRASADELPPSVVEMYYHGTMQKSLPALSTIVRALAEDAHG